MRADGAELAPSVRLRVAGMVLAAGAGRRYGMPKALVQYEDTLLVERAYRLVASVCDPVVVVLGAAAEEIMSRAQLIHAEIVVNPDWETGMGSSLRTGLAVLTVAPGGLRQNHQGDGLRQDRHGDGLRQDRHGDALRQDRHGDGLRQNRLEAGSTDSVDAVLVHLVDLPGMTVAALRRVAANARADALAVATYDGVRGHPVLLGRRHWAGVAESATGDQGARSYLAAHEVTEIECSDLADPTDLDYSET